MRGHAAGLGADEADEIGAVDYPVGAFAGIGSDHADAERMLSRDRILAVERGRHRDRQRLRQGHELGGCTGGSHAAAGNDHRPRRVLQMLEGGMQAGFLRRGPKRRNARELPLTQRLHVRLLGVDLALVAAELQMHRPRRARRRNAKRLAQHVGKARDLVDRGIELGHRLERRQVVDLLIDLAELGPRIAPAGHRDHRRVREPGIAQPGGQVECTDHLRRTYSRLARGARIAVGHVGCGLFAVNMQALDAGAPFHHREGLSQHGRHVKQMRDAVAFQHIGQAFRPAHFPVVS